MGVVDFVDREDFHELKQTRRWYVLNLARSKPVYVWRGDDRELPRPQPRVTCELWVSPTNQSYFYKEGPGAIASWAAVRYWIQSPRWTNGNWWDIQYFFKKLILLFLLQAPMISSVSSLAHKVQCIAHLHVRVGIRARVVRLIVYAFPTEAATRVADSLDESFVRWRATSPRGDAAHWLVIQVWLRERPVWMGTTLTESSYSKGLPEIPPQLQGTQEYQRISFETNVLESNGHTDAETFSER